MAQAAQTGKALSPTQKKAATIGAYLKQKQGAFAALLPGTLKPEKMMRGFWAAAARKPAILNCTPESVLNCFMVSASLGLEIGRLRGGMHVVPFGNTLTPVPDYRGLMDLAFRSGQVLGIRAVPVYDGDLFEYAEGTEDSIKHVPKLDADRSPDKLKLVYAVAHLKDARPQFVVLTRQEVEQHRNRSKARNDGPWVTDYVPMALKTAIKGLCNWLPAAPEKLVQAVEIDDRAERGEGLAGVFDFEIEGEAVHDDTAGSTDKLAADLKAKADANKPAPDAPETNQPDSGEPQGHLLPSTVEGSSTNEQFVKITELVDALHLEPKDVAGRCKMLGTNTVKELSEAQAEGMIAALTQDIQAQTKGRKK